MNIIISGLEFDVEYKTYGRYIPASRFDDAEFVEIELLGVKSQEDIRDILDANLDQEDIKTAVANELNNAAQDAA